MSSKPSFYKNVIVVGNNLLVRAVERGQEKFFKVPYKPTLYVPSKEPSQYKTLDGKMVKPFVAGDIRDTRDFIKQHDGVAGWKIYGQRNYAIQWIADNYKSNVDWSMDHIRVFTLDIETDSKDGFPDIAAADKFVTAITIGDSKTNHIYTWGLKPYVANDPDVTYIKCPNEHALLEAFVSFWESNYPDVVTGWNVRFFDIAYLVHRIERELGADYVKRLSPWGLVRERNISIQGKVDRTYEFQGLVIMDYMELYKKYTYVSQESFSLGYIADIELGETKTAYEGSLSDLYENDHQTYIDYNINDVRLVQKIDQKRRFIELIISMAYLARVDAYTVVYGPVKLWEILFYHYMRERDIVWTHNDNGSDDETFDGAFVKESLVGKYDWVVSFDLTSLYPSICRQFNISPETHIDKTRLPTELQQLVSGKTLDDLIDMKIPGLTAMLQKYDLTMAANFEFYTKGTPGILAELFRGMMESRSETKRKMLSLQSKLEASRASMSKEDAQVLEYEIAKLDGRQHALKILANSGYGALGNKFFCFYSTENAMAITMTGQLSSKFIESRMNAYMNGLLETKNTDYAIHLDTDSLFLNMGPIIKKLLPTETSKPKIAGFLSKIARGKFQPEIDKHYRELGAFLNCSSHLLLMKLEKICDTAIWSSKKNYVLSVIENEGVIYETPSIKSVGLAAVKSSTPRICRQSLKEAFKVCLHGTEEELQAHVEKFRRSFMGSKPEIIAFPRGVKEITKWMAANGAPVKGCPINTRAALNHNSLVKSLKLGKRIRMITPGDKIRYIYLKEPNTIRSNVIGFVDRLPSEFALEKYLDYDTMFDKAYLSAIKAVTDVIGWQPVKTVTVEDLFGI